MPPFASRWLSRMPSLLKCHWFVCGALIVILGDVLALFVGGVEPSRLLEAAALFDLAVLLPGLYWLCYRKTAHRLWLKTIGLACVGIWLAQKLVPPEGQYLLPSLLLLRYVGLAVLTFFEVQLLCGLYRFASRGETQQQLEEYAAQMFGVPRWLGTLLAFEMRVWRKLASFTEGRRKKRR